MAQKCVSDIKRGKVCLGDKQRSPKFLALVLLIFFVVSGLFLMLFSAGFGVVSGTAGYEPFSVSVPTVRFVADNTLPDWVLEDLKVGDVYSESFTVRGDKVRIDVLGDNVDINDVWLDVSNLNGGYYSVHNEPGFGDYLTVFGSDGAEVIVSFDLSGVPDRNDLFSVVVSGSEVGSFGLLAGVTGDSVSPLREGTPLPYENAFSKLVGYVIFILRGSSPENQWFEYTFFTDDYIEKVDASAGAVRLASGSAVKSCSALDKVCEADNIYNWVIDNVRYTLDPRVFEYTSGDYIQLPSETIDAGVGDCEDMSLLTISMLESVGIRTKLVISSYHAYGMVCLPFDEVKSRIIRDRPFTVYNLPLRDSNGVESCFILDPTLKSVFDEEEYIGNTANIKGKKVAIDPVTEERFLLE